MTPKTLQPLHNCPGDQTHEEFHGGGGKTLEKMRLYLVERWELQPELHLGHFRAAFGGLSVQEAAAGGGSSEQSAERSIHSQGSSGGFKSQHEAGRAGKMETQGPAEPS